MTRETIITGSDDWTARVWSLTRGTCDAVLTYHDSPILCVEYSPSDKGIITGMWPLLTFNARWAELCQIISMSDIWSLINMSGSSDGLIRFWENKGDVFWIVKITSSVLLHLFWTLFRRKKCVLAYLCQASCTSQRNQKSELMERARQFTYTLQHPHSRVMGEEKVNTWTQTGEEKINTWTQRGATAILQ
jgi:WD40 repeat protein